MNIVNDDTIDAHWTVDDCYFFQFLVTYYQVQSYVNQIMITIINAQINNDITHQILYLNEIADMWVDVMWKSCLFMKYFDYTFYMCDARLEVANWLLHNLIVLKMGGDLIFSITKWSFKSTHTYNYNVNNLLHRVHFGSKSTEISILCRFSIHKVRGFWASRFVVYV